MNLSTRQKEILEIVKKHDGISISQIKEQLNQDISIPQLNRDISKLVKVNYLQKIGAGRSTSYIVTLNYNLFAPLDTSNYFDLEPDNRGAKKRFNFKLIDALKEIEIFTEYEQQTLRDLKNEYQNNIATLSPVIYQKELERLTIELSWKSSQIEGNTYSLLETERLFKEQKEAENKTKNEATMLLNHKDTISYLLDYKSLATQIDLRTIEEIHSLLIKDLGVSRNIRRRSVGVTGTAYKPLENEHQIRESLELMCEVINSKESGFEKALIAVSFISYLQPFEDGNKRTGRMISNALLIADNACPLSYRSVDSLDYKKAMLLFYEQNNLSTFKEIFIEQNIFGAKNYFQ